MRAIINFFLKFNFYLQFLNFNLIEASSQLINTYFLMKLNAYLSS